MKHKSNIATLSKVGMVLILGLFSYEQNTIEGGYYVEEIIYPKTGENLKHCFKFSLISFQTEGKKVILPGYRVPINSGKYLIDKTTVTIYDLEESNFDGVLGKQKTPTPTIEAGVFKVVWVITLSS